MATPVLDLQTLVRVKRCLFTFNLLVYFIFIFTRTDASTANSIIFKESLFLSLKTLSRFGTKKMICKKTDSDTPSSRQKVIGLGFKFRRNAFKYFIYFSSILNISKDRIEANFDKQCLGIIRKNEFFIFIIYYFNKI
jgi:hypothetical protein